MNGVDLKEHINAILAEKELRYDQRFTAQENALAKADNTERKFEELKAIMAKYEADVSSDKGEALGTRAGLTRIALLVSFIGNVVTLYALFGPK